MTFDFNRTRHLFFLASFLILFSCASKEKKNFSEAQWKAQVEKTEAEKLYAPNFKGGRFYAPWLSVRDKNFFDVARWKLFDRSSYTETEKDFLPGVLPDTAGRLSKTNGDYIVWIGHNTFLVRIKYRYFLTDPIFSQRALLPKRLTPPAISLDQFNATIKENLTIIISHNHYDHLDRPSMNALPASARVFVPKGLKHIVQKMNKKDTVEMNWWQTHDLGNGFQLVCLPAQHWSMRISQGRNKSLWASWLLITPETTLYFGGDTGYFKGFREIGKQYPNIDYAFMATTAYHPRWFMHYNHINIPEAVQGFNELGARFFIPTQWGTFRLGSEPAGYPGLDLKRYIEKKNLDAKRFRIMDIGEILTIPDRS